MGIACAAAIAADLALGRRQAMWIMNIVWPVTALWSGPLGLWAYARYGRAGSVTAMQEARTRHPTTSGASQPFPVLVAKGTTHCGSGCTVGDIGAELLFLAVPITVFGRPMFGAWVYDFIAAFLLGIGFQYFTIKPMRRESAKNALKDALRADTLSLTAWQVGMYGWMAVATFAILRHELRPTAIPFWFMMQVAMLVGFLTSYPVNWWLLKKGIKEAM
jgi:hypothetical protein